MELVTASVDGQTIELDSVSEDTYQGDLTAPTIKSESAVYAVTVQATGDNGEMTTETKDLVVENSGFFPLEMIAAKPSGEESGYIRESVDIDLDIGDTDDFELIISQDQWNKDKFWYGTRLFIPDTEYGGIINDINPRTSTKEIVLKGPTWRGMLKKKIVQPPKGEDYLILSGELNTVLRELLGERFGALFVIPDVDSGITVSSWSVDRYVTLHDAMQKLVDAHGCRLHISYIEPEDLEYGYVTIQAKPVVDYSDELEYSQDGKVHFSIRDYRGGINHLICLGQGEGAERTVLHLYVQEDGTIGSEPYYTGLDEREAVYDYSGADDAELESGGIERLTDLKNYKSIEVTVDDVDLEIGDIIGGYEQITETYVAKPIVGKILTIKDGKAEIEYRVKGDD